MKSHRYGRIMSTIRDSIASIMQKLDFANEALFFEHDFDNLNVYTIVGKGGNASLRKKEIIKICI